jgi:flagellar L-ring protein precursor FlgH
MRYLLPIALGLAVLGCSLPKAHDPDLEKHPQIPYQEDALTEKPLSDGSLWQDRLMVSDLRARRLNDLVTVRIAEATTATVKGDLTTSRAGSNSYGAPGFLSHLVGIGSSNANSTAATNSTTNSYKGAGTTDRSAVFTTTITARVVKVLNNGNLIFEGYRDIQLNNEKQRLYVAGMVDPTHLDVNNSCSSTQVAELKVGYGGQGVVDETTKPGYVSRLLNYIWPF